MSMVLGVVPARGGSKGLPGKNLRVLSGKPLLAHAIACGLDCKEIDHMVVSTEDAEIGTFARHYGADVPFVRPKELASDTAPMLPVLQHTITESEKYYGKTVELLVLLDPTGPLRTTADVAACIDLVRRTDCDAAISCNRAHRSPYFNMVTEAGEYIELASQSAKDVGRRQDSPVVYDLNTVVWVYTRKALMQEQARIPRKSRLYLVPPERALDIDSEFDFEVLEYVFSKNKQNSAISARKMVA